MVLIELNRLIDLCQFEGNKNIRALIVPWDKYGFVLMVKSRQKVLILRTKSAPKPRVFKRIDTAIGICQQIGFSSVTIQFLSEHLEFDKPNWLKSEDDENE